MRAIRKSKFILSRRRVGVPRRLGVRLLRRFPDSLGVPVFYKRFLWFIYVNLLLHSPLAVVCRAFWSEIRAFALIHFDLVVPRHADSRPDEREEKEGSAGEGIYETFIQQEASSDASKIQEGLPRGCCAVG